MHPQDFWSLGGVLFYENRGGDKELFQQADRIYDMDMGRESMQLPDLKEQFNPGIRSDCPMQEKMEPCNLLHLF